MGIVSRAADVYYTYRFLRTLTTSWEDMDAYKLGLVDGNGKVLKKPSTSEEKDAYNLFFRLVFNVKRLMERLPFGKQRIASYAAALYLIKENTGMSDDQIRKVFDEINLDIEDLLSEETEWYVLEDGSLSPGSYTLTQDIASPLTGDIIALKGTTAIVDEGTKPVGLVFNESIYRIRHVQTKQEIYVSSGDITK